MMRIINKKRRWVRYAMIGFLLISVIVFFRIYRRYVYDRQVIISALTPETFDATPLYTKLAGCDAVEIIKCSTTEANETIYESRDLEEVRRLVDLISVKTQDVRLVGFGIPKYYMVFYRGNKEMVWLDICLPELYWQRGSWEWGANFSLTDESFDRFVSWFCEKTGEPEEWVKGVERTGSELDDFLEEEKEKGFWKWIHY